LRKADESLLSGQPVLELAVSFSICIYGNAKKYSQRKNRNEEMNKKKIMVVPKLFLKTPYYDRDRCIYEL
jgi:hypothetical protein